MRDGLPPAPHNIRALPLDHRGYPIPWFVHIDADGKEDFRIIGAGKMLQAHKKRLCWICGRSMGRMQTFVIGPMCAVNRISAEPPSHLECARFAAQACPFLSHPLAKRNERDPKPAEVQINPDHLEHNPGVTLVWATLWYKPVRAGSNVLFEIGLPERAEWYREGRPATREEALAGIHKGLPFLRQAAEEEGAEALAELERRYGRALRLLPEAA